MQTNATQMPVFEHAGGHGLEHDTHTRAPQNNPWHTDKDYCHIASSKSLCCSLLTMQCVLPQPLPTHTHTQH